MDSRLDNIFRTTFRHTESADTWMGIRREEPRDDQRRKKDEDGEKKERLQWEDDTVVSIAALKQFLSTLIAPESEFQQTKTEGHEMPALSSQQQRAHNAVHAYQNTAQHAPTTPVTPPTAPAPEPSLSQDENRAIYLLLNDLDLLLQNGVTALTIRKEGSFLESLTQAAKTMLEKVT